MEINSRQVGIDEIEVWEGSGAYCPDGMSADDIMTIATILEDREDLAPYTSRNLAIEIIRALRARGKFA